MIRQIGWSVSSTACSAIAFVLSFHFCKIPPDYKPAVVSGVSTIASICQIISEDELTTEMRALHFVGCGAGAVVAIATLLRKAQPEVAIALGGFGVIVDFPITLIAGVKGQSSSGGGYHSLEALASSFVLTVSGKRYR